MPTIQELASETKQSTLEVAKIAKEQGFSGGISVNLPPAITQAIRSKTKALAPANPEYQSEKASQAQSNNEMSVKQTANPVDSANLDEITNAVGAFSDAAEMRSNSIDELKRIIAAQRGRLQAFTLHRVQETAFHDTMALLEEEGANAYLRSYYAEMERYKKQSQAENEALALHLETTEGNCQKRQDLVDKIQEEMNQLSLNWQNSKHASSN